MLIWLLSAVFTFAESSHFCCLLDSTRYVIPAAHYSVAEEVSPDFEMTLPHFQVERFCCAPGRSHIVRCSLEPLTAV